MSMKRDTVKKIRTDVESIIYSTAPDTDEPTMVFTYPDKSQITLRLTVEETTSLKNLTDYISEHIHDTTLLGELELKKDAFDKILNYAIQRELTLFRYDSDYLK